ncbi:flagellar biosynthesis regulator FlaF [Limobrevibacterium gyesilva]|nr:flagellar biosynthesis regulator FlaF [Limobrevibacterium gyesilva]
MADATRAYAASSAHRSAREQEADVFRRANVALRQSATAGAATRARALADNGRLWTTLIDLTRDPQNQLPQAIRASIISVGLAVQREMQNETPDLEFLVNVNENLALGLSARP